MPPISSDLCQTTDRQYTTHKMPWQETLGLVQGALGVLLGILGLSPLQAYLRTQFPRFWPEKQPESYQAKLDKKMDKALDEIKEIVDTIPENVQSIHDTVKMAIESSNKTVFEVIEKMEIENQEVKTPLSEFITEVMNESNERVRREAANKVIRALSGVAAPEPTTPPT